MTYQKKWKPKVGDILYGHYNGFGRNRYTRYEAIEVQRVGRQYLYTDRGDKIEIRYNGAYPQYDDLVATDTDQNHSYCYYRTEEGAIKAYKAKELRLALRVHDFSTETNDMIIHIARILGIDKQEQSDEN